MQRCMDVIFPCPNNVDDRRCEYIGLDCRLDFNVVSNFTFTYVVITLMAICCKNAVFIAELSWLDCRRDCNVV